MTGRLILVVLLAAVAAVQVVRTAFVRAYVTSRPALAALLWPGHPDVILRLEFERIGRSTAAGRPVPGDSVERIIRTARRAPLAPEPFLARGVRAQEAGLESRAGESFLEARRRDPRAVAARYFLADHYQRTNQLEQGLAEISVLARLVPAVAVSLSPYLAEFAKTAEGARQLRHLLASDPTMAVGVLDALAADPANADLVLFLAAGRSMPTAPWPSVLIQKLVETGQYATARAVWTRLFGHGPNQPRGLIFNPDFAASDAPPPFNWQFASTPSGIAEVEGSGQLRIIYYGRDDLVLTSQLLLLEPGSYQLSFRHTTAGAGAARLAWRLTCLPSNQSVLQLGLGQGSGESRRQSSLTIPAGCPAQRLELAADAPDFPATTNVAIGQLRLTKAGQQ